MTEIFRFRSIDQLIDDYSELETQSIYFASRDELNDPFEGYKNVIYQSVGMT